MTGNPELDFEPPAKSAFGNLLELASINALQFWAISPEKISLRLFSLLDQFLRERLDRGRAVEPLGSGIAEVNPA
jgi:hypothetical protein